MEYAKLDTRLSEALADADDETTVFEVFIDLDAAPAPDDLQRLARFGVAPDTGPSTIITARLSREALSVVSELPAVRQVTLRRRLRK